MSDEDILDDFDGMVDVSEVDRDEVKSRLIDRLSFDAKKYDFEPPRKKPLKVEKRLEENDDPDAEIVLYKLAKLAREQDYDDIVGCIAFERPRAWECRPDDVSVDWFVRGIGFTADRERYLFLENTTKSPWHEHLRIERPDAPLNPEYHMDRPTDSYVYIRGNSSDPFWEYPNNRRRSLTDWPPDFED